MISLILQILLFPTPWILRRPLLSRLLSVTISENSYIGLSILDAGRIVLGDNIYFGHFNFIGRLTELRLENGCRIKSFNWISGAYSGCFSLNENSALQRFSYYDCSGSISIGRNTIIAGRGSQFYTHGVKPDELDNFAAITIGDYCYVGSRCSFVPGAVVGNKCFVAMNSTVITASEEHAVLLAGSPAKVVKRYNGNEIYFTTPRKHPHHEQ